MIAEIDEQALAPDRRDPPHPKFQKLESAWRGLKFVVDRTDFPREHQDRAPELLEGRPPHRLRGLPRDRQVRPLQASSTRPSTASSAASRSGRSSPTTSSGPARRTSRCSQKCAAVATMAHAPFIAAAGAAVLRPGGLPATLPNLKDLKSIFEGPQYTKWQFVPRVRGRALRRPDAAALPPAPAVRRRDTVRSRPSTTRRT